MSLKIREKTIFSLEFVEFFSCNVTLCYLIPLGPGTDMAIVEQLQEGIRTGKDTSVCLLNYRADGTPFFNQVLYVGRSMGYGWTIRIVVIENQSGFSILLLKNFLPDLSVLISSINTHTHTHTQIDLCGGYQRSYWHYHKLCRRAS